MDEKEYFKIYSKIKDLGKDEEGNYFIKEGSLYKRNKGKIVKVIRKYELEAVIYDV